MRRTYAIAVVLSLLVHLALAAAVRMPGATAAARPAHTAIDTIAVAFLPPPRPVPPPPPPRLVPRAAPAPDNATSGAAMQGTGRPVRRAPVERPAETRRPAAVERRGEAPATPPRTAPRTRPSPVPPVATPRTPPSRTPSPDRVVPRQPPGTPTGTADGSGTRDRPDARADGGGRPGLQSTRETTAGSPTGTADGSTSGAPGTGTTAASGAGGGVDVSGFGARRLVSRPLPSNTDGATVTLSALIEARPDGSVRLIRWQRVGNPALQRQAAAALARWRFATLPSGVPQEAQTGVVTFRFVAN